MPTRQRAIRGRLLTFLDDPVDVGQRACHRYIEDGVVVIEEGRIARLDEARTLLPELAPEVPVDHYPDALIMPGFIDPHIHYSQTQVIASFGAQLLDWLENYTFVEEQKFSDTDHAARVASFFLDELLRNGTTTAAVYCTVHTESVDAFFAESSRRNTRMIAGKVLMDRGAPDELLDTAQLGYDQSKELIARWHGRGRQHYGVTPRFAITSSSPQLDAVAVLSREHPDAFVQTHLAENKLEIETVKKLFPDARSYTDVYDRHALLGPQSLFGHCIHLDNADLSRLSETRSVAVFCPTSNLFLGSGLFDLERMRETRFQLRTAIATDVGAGTSYSMLRTVGEAYKMLQLRGDNLPALHAFYMITLGNSRALGLEQSIGALEPGHDADIVVLDARATPAMAHRMETIDGDLEEELFILMTLGDDRSVRATYVAGECLHTS